MRPVRTCCVAVLSLRYAHALPSLLFFFFFNDTATTEIYTLSLHDALPISFIPLPPPLRLLLERSWSRPRDRKSTRLNSSHGSISYAVFCLKKKKKPTITTLPPLTRGHGALPLTVHRTRFMPRGTRS